MPVNGGFVQGNVPQDNLILGNPFFTDTVILDENQDLVRGAVLGKKTVGGNYILSDDGAADGSETPKAILLEDATTGAAETLTVPVLVFGKVNEDSLSFGGTHDKTTVKDPLRLEGIYLGEVSPG